ncbi:MAG: endolytic transglycosylase MltG [Oscillibacter sp.]|nr:endolytic transglycosylase MltG [Oscillibacter sp.]
MADHKNGDTASWDKEQVRRAQPPQKRPRRKRRHRFAFALLKLVLHIVFVLLASALLAEIGWLLFSDFCSLNNGGQKATENISVQITADDTVSSIAEKLGEAGLVDYPWFFRLYAQFSHAEEKIGIGTYNLNNDMDYHALIAGMHSSSGSMNEDTVRVTIPEGYTVAQTISLLAKNGVNTETALLEAAKTANFNYDFIDNDSEEISRLEGYLFPDTYDFYVNEKPASALNRLISNFNSKIDDELLTAAEARGYNLHKIITIASLIEKETDGSDQDRIASVIYNRLDGPGDKAGTYGMLQVDASLLYGLPDNHEGPITQTDMQLDSPYNLYKNAGLPPTPIANPGLAAISAALDPEHTDYYYYALGKDSRHHFFTNYNDHINFVNSSEYYGN